MYPAVGKGPDTAPLVSCGNDSDSLEAFVAHLGRN